MSGNDNQGEGNREADRRYRESVQDTVERTSEAERADMARDVDADQLKRDREAEEEGKSHARD